MILTGSSALRFHFPDFPRTPKDMDYIVQSSKPRRGNIEFLVNTVFADYPFTMIQPNDLLTLKMSHLFWNINWEKHMFDVQFLLKKGCKINLTLFNNLYIYWNEVHGKNKRSDLKMSAEDFFDNNLKSEYSHDWLHTLINPVPTYTKVLIGEVEVGEEKFNALSYDEKCALVYEEVMIMAWERFKYLDYREAYGLMLKKFIISHAPIWEAIFIIENFIELHKPKFNYYKLIENGINTTERVTK